ncbi:MAG: MBL fold metallo-hydrolase [Patescibacteria group bacterium]
MDKREFQLETLVVGQLATNCYLLMDLSSRQAVIIDPGDDAEYIAEYLERMRAEPIMILATHGHFDHLLAASFLQLTYKVPFLISLADKFLVERMVATAFHFLGIRIDPPPKITGKLTPGQKMRCGNLTIGVVATPGHTPGSVSFALQEAKILFVGDLLFAGGALGRTDFSYSQKTDLTKSLQKVFTYPPETIIYPGHGAKTTIKDEIRYHKF